MIDIHCHLLPEVDDGPKSWDAAVEMCRMAAADGITHAVATPHANDRYAYDRAYLSGLLTNCGTVAREDRSHAAIAIESGLRFASFLRESGTRPRQPHTYTIGETNYLLVELSNYSVPAQLADCFFRLGDRGLTPILTHPERNPILQQTPQRVLEWAEQGCLMQVTASIADRVLGRAARNHRPLAARPLGRPHPRLGRSRHEAPHPESFRGSRRGGKNRRARVCRSAGRGQPGGNRQRDADSLLPAAGAGLTPTEPCQWRAGRPARRDGPNLLPPNVSPQLCRSPNGPRQDDVSFCNEGPIGGSRSWNLRNSPQPASFETFPTPVASLVSNLRSISVSIPGRAVC